jgi:hypothetical protein
MSLIVGIRAAEGLVLATDSLLRWDEAVYLTARKLFTFPEQPHVAVAACGLLSLGRGELRPLPVLMDAFRDELRAAGGQRLSTYLVAQMLGAFLAAQWRALMPSNDDQTMDLIVAGFDQGMPYGDLWRLQLPTQPAPLLQRLPTQAYFAGYWGSLAGVDKMTDPYAFPRDIMPLADCAALAAHLITSTAQLEAWSTKPQRIGGPAQVVTIAQADGARWVMEAQI